ncbi:MAG: hypothetical protein A4S09_02240 [Proteobacteria bacterium SG_bin7]|nr:MAG: hypothetical protein A4S09_02240 [Proteobacteria bacterium SG_bin7]
MNKLFMLLFLVIPSFSFGQVNMSLPDGIYLNPSACDEMVTNDFANNSIYVRVVNDCSISYKGNGWRSGPSSFNVLYEGDTLGGAQIVSQELVDRCVPSNNRPKSCLSQFYDKNGKFLLQVGDYWRHGHVFQILNHSTYTKAYFEQFERSGSVVLTFVHDTGVSQKPIWRR